MYVSPEDARSDVILAGAAAVFGPILLALIAETPGIPRTGVGGRTVALVFAFAITGLVPYLLARYRQDVPHAFALRREPVSIGVLLALPLVALGVLRAWAVFGEFGPAALGRISGAALSSPTVGLPQVDLVGGVLAVAEVLVLTVGGLLLISFLTVRGRDAFRTDERSATELLRTFGMGAAAVALLLGLARSLVGASWLLALLNAGALAALVLLADQRIPARVTVTRAAVLTPAVLVVLLHVFAAGGLFRGDILRGIQTGALAGGVTVVLAVLTEQRRSSVVAIPILFALSWWESCLSPVPIGAGLGAC